MRIAIMGAGGVGGYFGGLLARGGNQVIFIARGAHLQSIKTHGLTVKGHDQQFTVAVTATDDPREVFGPIDLLLFTVKTYQNSSAIPFITPLISNETTILTLQNGVESHLELSKLLGRSNILPGAAYIESEIESPGIIKQQGEVVRIVFGELDGKDSVRAQHILDTFLKSGINAEFSSDISKTIWTKFLFIVSMAGLTTVARAPMAKLLPIPEVRKLLEASMHEVVNVAAAKGINLHPRVVENTLKYIEDTVQNLKASMHKDLELGRHLELDALNGAITRMGTETGVPTPINEFIYSILKIHKDGSSST